MGLQCPPKNDKHYFATGTWILHTDSGLRQALFYHRDLTNTNILHSLSSATTCIILLQRLAYCTLIQGYDKHCSVTGTCILHTDSGLRQALFCYRTWTLIQGYDKHCSVTGTCILHTDSGLRQALFCYRDLHTAHWFGATTSIILPQGLAYCTLIQGYRHCLVMWCICCNRTTLIGTNYHVDPLKTVSSLSPTGFFTLAEHKRTIRRASDPSLNTTAQWLVYSLGRQFLWSE